MIKIVGGIPLGDGTHVRYINNVLVLELWQGWTVVFEPPTDILLIFLQPPDVVLNLFQGLLPRSRARATLRVLCEESLHLFQLKTG